MQSALTLLKLNVSSASGLNYLCVSDLCVRAAKTQVFVVCNITRIYIAGAYSSNNIYFYSSSLQLPYNFHDIEMERVSDYILVSKRQVFTLAWQSLSSSIYIKMSTEFVGRTCGLCGNFNADVQDDLKTSYGKFFWL